MYYNNKEPRCTSMNRAGLLHLFIFLLLMDSQGGTLGARPPGIPFLTILQDGEPHVLYTNQTTKYSTQSFSDLEVVCEVEVEEEEEDREEVNYYWNLVDVPVPADKDFQIVNGSLRFLEPSYGMFECFASNSAGKSYSTLTLTQHEEDGSPILSLTQGPSALSVSAGSSVRFGCAVQPTSAASSPPPQFSWTFNTAAVKTVRPSWRVRSVSDVEQVLEAEDVSAEDVGTVGCLVVGGGERLYQEGSLRILPDVDEPMSAPEISVEPGSDLKLLEDETVVLRCTSSGTPAPSVAWFRNSERVAEAGELNLENLPRGMSGEYVCAAENAAGISRQSVSLEVFWRTSTSRTEVETVKFLNGDSLSLECTYRVDDRWGSEVLVKWTRDGEEVLENNKNILTEPGRSVLTLVESTDSEAGSYTCQVSTPLDQVAVEWEVELVAPATIVHLESDKMALVGSVTILSCEAVGTPIPEIEWFYNDQAVEQVPGDVLVAEDGSLRLLQVRLDQSGPYTCQATNQFGSDSKILNLGVAKPTSPILKYESGEVELPASQTFDLPCDSSIDPLLSTSVIYTWYKDDKEVSQDFVQSEHHLHIPYLLSEHGGKYSCEIRTLLDIIRINTELTVITAEPNLISPAFSTIGEVLGGDVSIPCSATGIPAPRITFKFKSEEYLGRSLAVTTNLTEAVLDIGNVTEEQDGEYVCLAVNEYGNSQGSTVLDVYRRTKIVSGPGDVVLKSGDSTTIPCQVDVDPGLQSSLRISWLKNQAPIDKTSNGFINKQDSFVMRNLRKIDEGIYTCVAETSKDRTTLSGRITVMSEAPTFSSTPRDIRILEGRNTELVCQANGIPAPTIHWTFKDQNLRSLNGILPLSSLSMEKEGNYVCTAENIYGSVSEVVNLQVIKGARKENKNLVPDIVKNIKDTISLPCDFKVDHRIEEETRVIWSKEGRGEVPLLSSSKYRVERNRSLLIRNIELEDGGQYTCKVITPLQEVESRISLIVSGESPEIVNSFDKVMIHEGETLSLTCRARGVPTPAIEWLLKDLAVPSQYVVHEEEEEEDQSEGSEFHQTKIVIQAASKKQEGVYQCVARNNVGTVVKNSHVRVLKRTKVSISSEEGRADITVSAGQKLKLPCKVDNDEMNRITRIQWTKDGESIQVGGHDIIDFGMDGSITIFNVQKRHEGVYRCTVRTVKDEASAEIPLRVLVNAPVITKYSGNQIMFSGTSTSLECLATGIPEPETRWTFNRTITKVIGPNFEIKNAISADSGFYTCTSRNSIGETQRTISVTVVTLPLNQDVYQAKQGSVLKLPCLRNTDTVRVLWLKDNQPIDRPGPDTQIDPATGSMVFTNLSTENEGVYKCRVAIDSGRVERVMQVKLMPDIMAADNTRLQVKEGDSFTLKCDVLSGVNAKRLWKKDGILVFSISGSGLVDIQQQEGILTVKQAKPTHSGEWECVASTAWGQDSIIYSLSVVSRSARKQRRPCTERVPPVITDIASTSNTSVVLEWEVADVFNASCFQEFLIFWWSAEADSTHDNQTTELRHRKATIHGLKTEVSYYFQVNLVRDRALKEYVYGQTKSHVINYIQSRELTSDSHPKAVIIIVIIVIVILVSLLVLLYFKRDSVSQYLAERSKTNKQQEFTEFSSKLVANPDFMASLAPQWPEPEPQPSESHSFIQHQRPLSRRNSKTSITSSWSSLFNVVSNENLPAATEAQEKQYRGRRRQN